MSQPGSPPNNSARRWIVLSIAAVLIIAAVLSYASFAGLFRAKALTCASLEGTGPPANENATAPTSGQAEFLIVEADPGNVYEGMNGSAYHMDEAWPVMIVHEGQTVVIHIINCASSESHGFAITHYFDAGVALGSGHSYTLTFVATEKGTFRVFCNIFCAIHPLMQNGQLVVI